MKKEIFLKFVKRSEKNGSVLSNCIPVSHNKHGGETAVALLAFLCSQCLEHVKILKHGQITVFITYYFTA